MKSVDKIRRIKDRATTKQWRKIIRDIRGEARLGRVKMDYPWRIPFLTLQKLRNEGFTVKAKSEYVKDWWEISWI
jgi:hypothetical protein